MRTTNTRLTSNTDVYPDEVTELTGEQYRVDAKKRKRREEREEFEREQRTIALELKQLDLERRMAAANKKWEEDE